MFKDMGLGRFELPTSRLSGVRSNQLSYRPVIQIYTRLHRLNTVIKKKEGYRKKRKIFLFHRKEVIQPQVLLRLPCYDFTPITGYTVGVCLHCWLAQRHLVSPTFVV
jgi:hypothetical protein